MLNNYLHIGGVKLTMRQLTVVHVCCHQSDQFINNIDSQKIIDISINRYFGSSSNYTDIKG